MAYTGKWLKINGVTIPGLKDFKVTYAKLWKEAQRNMDGDVTASFIGIFPKVELIFRDALTDEEVSKIGSLLNIPYFTAEFYSPVMKGAISAKYYASDFSLDVLERKRALFKEFSVNLIPVSKQTATVPIEPDPDQPITPGITYDNGELERF